MAYRAGAAAARELNAGREGEETTMPGRPAMNRSGRQARLSRNNLPVSLSSTLSVLSQMAVLEKVRDKVRDKGWEPVAAAILAAVEGGILTPGNGDGHGLMSWDSLRLGG